MIVNCLGVPVQVIPESEKEGVTVMVAVMGLVVLLTAVNELMGPCPDVAKLIAELLLDQLYFIPLILPVKFIAAVLLPLHTS